MQWQDVWQERRKQVILVGLGILFLALGAGQMWRASRGDAVEVVVESDHPKERGESTDNMLNDRTVVVDVGGAVKSPGVYRLKQGARVAEVILEAGGFASGYDASWVEKFVNQAELVQDGQKIYIPEKNVLGAKSESGEDDQLITTEKNNFVQSEVINVNTADQKTLETLWGIGEARAQAIISARPYGSLDELKEKAKIPQNVIERNQGKWSVY